MSLERLIGSQVCSDDDVAMEACLFCGLESQISTKSRFFYVLKDKFPVTDGHLLIVPKAHRQDLFDLTREEFAERYDVLAERRSQLSEKDPSIRAWTVGANCGEAAGQTIFHCHVHLIPRRRGDVALPRRGVRGVIPSKQSY